MKKRICLLLSCVTAFSLMTFGYKSLALIGEEPIPDTTIIQGFSFSPSFFESMVNGEGAADGAQSISNTEIIGKYVEKDSGLPFRVDNDRIFIPDNWLKFWKMSQETMGLNYQIRGTHLSTFFKSEGWDSFDITPYGSGYSLSNDHYTFIPYDDYYNFEHTTVFKTTDQASSDNISINLLDVEYTETIDILEYVSEIWVRQKKDEFILEAPKDKCFVRMHVTLENSGREAYKLDDVYMSLIYDNGYVFNSGDTEGNSLIVKPDNYLYVRGDSGVEAGNLSVSPLCSIDFTINMLCPSALMKHPDKSLKAAFSVAGVDGKPVVLVFDLR